ncbi:hypothetical protein [Desulfosarcina widdelii]|uniref:hypothetical protein n=1 Tax=Desulfosarcina widdelii TaxID=947919 RepID=UPI0012D36093|nr:hypothetical protein [Desulfosarcina widdelii]
MAAEFTQTKPGAEGLSSPSAPVSFCDYESIRYPKIPQPKAIVQAMENATTMMSHTSSFFTGTSYR